MPSDAFSVVTTALQDPGEWLSTSALAYTSNPWSLAWNDILLFFAELPYLPTVCSPIGRFNSGVLDELYPSAQNLFCIAVHTFLVCTQIFFIVSVPTSLLWPAPFGTATFFIYAAVFLVTNKFLCDWLLNGPEPTIRSRVDISQFPKHDDEQWIFLNGVGVGKHWIQANVDRLALSFGRPVLGVHNPTTGIVFDVVQCLIQRDFGYATQDVRNAYADIKKALAREETNKVVFIVHSQGGIQGSLILDWLYADVPGILLTKLEVYTFGNAANHFNNPEHAPDDFEPGKHMTPRGEDPGRRVVRHIEHYANSSDFVSRWGVLFFASQRAAHNRYRGRVLESNKDGHLLNQHYLDSMFPLDEETGCGLSEHNAFMKSEIQVAKPGQQSDLTKTEGLKRPHPKRSSADPPSPASKVVVRNLTYPMEPASKSLDGPGSHFLTVGEVSRLWMYRNGRTPPD